MPTMMKFMFKYIMMPFVMPRKGLIHSLEIGAKRYVDGISDDSYKTGTFYASKKGSTGEVVDQRGMERSFCAL